MNKLFDKPLPTRHQCYQSSDTNIGDSYFEKTKLRLDNKALLVALEFVDIDIFSSYICVPFALTCLIHILRYHYNLCLHVSYFVTQIY